MKESERERERDKILRKNVSFEKKNFKYFKNYKRDKLIMQFFKLSKKMLSLTSKKEVKKDIFRLALAFGL